MTKFRVHTEDINTMGFWIQTSGIDMSGFRDNPIALYNHIECDDDVLPIGYWDDIQIVENGDITMGFNVDPDDEFAMKIQKKIDNKVLRATSIGIQAIEWSDDPALMKPGQKWPTITKSRLREVSVVDIPANKSAIALYDTSGKLISLSDKGELNNLFFNNSAKATTHSSMELKEIAKKLKLRSDANESDVIGAIDSIADTNHNLSVENQKLKDENSSLQDQFKKLREAEIENILNDAITAKKFAEDQKATFRSVLTADFDSGKKAIEAITPTVKLSDFTGAGGKSTDLGKAMHLGKTFKELSKENPAELAKLKDQSPELFKALYKSEFGTDYKG
jgi:hypothetical protein